MTSCYPRNTDLPPAIFCYIGTNHYICNSMKLIEMNIDKIIALCKKYKVGKLWVFGSILTPRFNDESDVDFSVVFHYNQIQNLFVTFFDFIE